MTPLSPTRPGFLRPPRRAACPQTHRLLVSEKKPKAAGVRKEFYDPYSNYGHYARLEVDGISEWHPSFLQLASTLKDCSKPYESFCQQYHHHTKAAPKSHWGSRMLKRLVEEAGRSKSKRISQGQQQLPCAFDLRLNQIPDDWQQIVVRFRRANGIRDGDGSEVFGSCGGGVDVSIGLKNEDSWLCCE